MPIRIVPIEKSHEKEAYRIWHRGMSTDLILLFLEYCFKLQTVRIVLGGLVIVALRFKSWFWAFLALAFLAIVIIVCWSISYFYIQFGF